MRALGIDPGALRCGYALVEKGQPPVLHASGTKGLSKGDTETFQSFKVRLLEYWLVEAALLLTELKPTTIGIELLPAVGSGNFVAATQSELAKTVALTIHIVALQRNIPVQLIAASSVKKAVVGRAGTKKDSVTKVTMRNAVQDVFPELREREWGIDDLAADETDAVAVALATVGYTRPK